MSMKAALPVVLALALAACGQQAEPETAPLAGGSPKAGDAEPAATAPTEQVGMSPTSQPGSPSNPTGRGPQGDSGRGQGPAPGQSASQTPAAPSAGAVSPDEARGNCERLAEPQRAECLRNIARGTQIDAARDAERRND